MRALQQTPRFEIPLCSSGKTGPWNGQKAVGFYGFAGQFTGSIATVADSLQGLLDFIKNVLAGGKHAQSPIPIIGICGGIGHVLPKQRIIPVGVGILRQHFLLGQKLLAKFDELLLVP